jgi:hypothetical protein
MTPHPPSVDNRMELSVAGPIQHEYRSLPGILATFRCPYGSAPSDVTDGSTMTISEVMVNGPDDVYVERKGPLALHCVDLLGS